MGGWLYSDYNASVSSNWTELDWTGTELGNSYEISTNFNNSCLDLEESKALIRGQNLQMFCNHSMNIN